MSDDFISLSDFNSLSDPVIGFRQEQGDRSWQPFGERKFGNKIFIRRVFAIFGTKELVPFTQLVKVRGGNLVWALPSIRFS